MNDFVSFNKKSFSSYDLFIPRPSVWVSNVSPKRSVFGGFLVLKFQTQTEDSWIQSDDVDDSLACARTRPTPKSLLRVL